MIKHTRPADASFFRSDTFLISLIFYLGLLLRLILIPNPGFEADISFWKSWGLAPYNHGIVWSFFHTNNNYPAPFAYVLMFLVKIYSLFADPNNFNEFWRNTNQLYLFIGKLPAIMGDFCIASLILWIGKHARRIGFPDIPFRIYIFLSALFLLNPVTLIDSAWWGQVDAFGVAIFFIGFVFALKKKPFLAGFFYIFAVMMKLQNMIYGPLFFFYLWLTLGWTGLVQSLAGGTLAFFGLNIEFVLSRNMAKVAASLTDNFDYFPLMSLNSYNLWWIVSKAQGMAASDKLTAFGIINAKTLGLSIFASTYLLSMLYLFWPRFHEWIKGREIDREDLHHRFITGICLIVLTFFLFQTQSHERYAFPAVAFLLLWAPFYLTESRKAKKENSKKAERDHNPSRFTLHASRFTLHYILFSLLYFYNIHTSLVRYNPYNGLAFLSKMNQPAVTITVSVLLLSLFGLFLIPVLARMERPVVMIPILIFAALITFKHLPLLTKQPVLLTSFAPFISYQDFGKRVTDKSVNSYTGSSAWNPLSVQYAFYRKGIGTHANSNITYDINRKFKTFSFDYGIDTEAGAGGTAIFEVYGDGKKLFASEKMGRFTMPKHADVNVTGIKFLGLITTDAGDGINSDHTDWLNPMLWP